MIEYFEIKKCSSYELSEFVQELNKLYFGTDELIWDPENENISAGNSDDLDLISLKIIDIEFGYLIDTSGIQVLIDFLKIISNISATRQIGVRFDARVDMSDIIKDDQLYNYNMNDTFLAQFGLICEIIRSLIDKNKNHTQRPIVNIQIKFVRLPYILGDSRKADKYFKDMNQEYLAFFDKINDTINSNGNIIKYHDDLSRTTKYCNILDKFVVLFEKEKKRQSRSIEFVFHIANFERKV